jgi:predicted nucleic acid-binding protein
MNLDVLTDTNIFIDVMRGYTPALKWLQSNPSLVLGLQSVVRMELVLGTSSKVEQKQVLNFLADYPVIYPNEDDSKVALAYFETFHLSHKIDVMDCFIAAMNARLEVPVATRNLKHFLPFKSIRIIQPYA